MCLCSLLSCFLSWVSRAHLAAIFLWTAAVLCGISFVSPFWMSNLATNYFGMSMICPRKDIGLLAECCATGKCTWVWDNGFHLERTMPESRRVTQLLFLPGLLLLLPALLMSPFRFCCECSRKSVGLSRMLAVFTFLASGLFGSAVLYFFYNLIWGEASPSQVLFQVNIWSWAFVMALVGSCFALASAMFWYLDGKREVVTFNIEHENQQKREKRGIRKR